MDFLTGTKTCRKKALAMMSSGERLGFLEGLVGVDVEDEVDVIGSVMTLFL